MPFVRQGRGRSVAKLNGIDREAYLTDLITRIVQGHPQSRIDDLPPWNLAREPATTPP